jgi:hypothetical protein
MKTITLAVLSVFAASCGQDPTKIIGQGERAECVETLGLTGTTASTNCKVVGPTPTPTPSLPHVGLVFEGDILTPPPSAYSNQGSVQVPQGTPASWQLLGMNNSPSVTKSVGTTMTLPGHCRAVNIKVVTGNAPSQHAGTFYLTSDGHKFKVCIENGKIAVTYEDGVDTLFNDYKILISSSNGQPLDYKLVNGQLFACLD